MEFTITEKDLLINQEQYRKVEKEDYKKIVVITDLNINENDILTIKEINNKNLQQTGNKISLKVKSISITPTLLLDECHAIIEFW